MIEIIGDKNLEQFLKSSKEKLKKLSEYFQTIHQADHQTQLTIKIVSDEEIKSMNKKFRKKNKITDVLSFPFHTKKELKKKIKLEKEVYLGDIIINLNKIKGKNEKENFKIEFDRLWIHGLVHLFGYDHKKDNDYLKMKKIEKKYFDFINA